jgi:choline dehydrogenase-like flavoprotein
LVNRSRGELQLFGLNIRAEQTPLADSRVTLSTDRDELGVRKPQLDWRIRPKDGHDIRRTLELIGAEFGRTGLGRMWIGHEGLELTAERHWGYHHMGGTRMGASALDSVVDANCRAHDLDNFYIAGSSVFRTSGFANPTLTIIALARRLGVHLKELS